MKQMKQRDILRELGKPGKRNLGKHLVWFKRHRALDNRCIWEVDGKMFVRYHGWMYEVYVDHSAPNNTGYMTDDWHPTDKTYNDWKEYAT